MHISLQHISAAKAALITILRRPLYAVIALATAFVTFALSVWLPNLDFIATFISSPRVALGEKIAFLWSSLGAITTNFSLLAALLTIAISILFGLNVALTVYYFQRRLQFQKVAGIGTLGMLLGLVGVGCASCGSIVLSIFLGIGATAAVTGVLPFGGQEFSMLSVAVLFGTLYVIAKKAGDPLVCDFDVGNKK